MSAYSQFLTPFVGTQGHLFQTKDYFLFVINPGEKDTLARVEEDFVTVVSEYNRTWAIPLSLFVFEYREDARQ